MVSLVHLGIIICPELYSELPQCVKDSDFGTRAGLMCALFILYK